MRPSSNIRINFEDTGSKEICKFATVASRVPSSQTTVKCHRIDSDAILIFHELSECLCCFVADD